MEEFNNIVPVNDEARKDYVPPSAEIILLTAQENLALLDEKFHSAEDRWALGGWAWGEGTAFDPESGTYNVYAPEGWKLPQNS